MNDLYINDVTMASPDERPPAYSWLGAVILTLTLILVLVNNRLFNNNILILKISHQSVMIDHLINFLLIMMHDTKVINHAFIVKQKKRSLLNEFE